MVTTSSVDSFYGLVDTEGVAQGFVKGAVVLSTNKIPSEKNMFKVKVYIYI